MKRFLCMIAAVMLFMPAVSLAESGLSVRMPAEVYGYQENIINIYCPRAGLLSLKIHMEDGTLLYELPPMNVAAGETVIRWDGLGAWDKPLPRGTCFIQCILDDGLQRDTAKAYFEMGKPAQAIVFALGSAEKMNPKGEAWYITYKLVRSGRVVIEICQEGVSEPLQVIRKQVGSSKPQTYEWKGRIHGELAADGHYTLRIYAADNPAYVKTVDVTVDSSLPKPSVDVTGMVFPEMKADYPVCFAAPAVVSVAGDGSVMNIYAQKDTQSRVLGTVSGQTQCLQVHSITGDWADVTVYRREDGAPVRGFARAVKLKAVTVHEEYALVISRETGMMTVFHDGTAIGAMPVTLGGAVGKKAEYETISGSFLVDTRSAAVTTKNGTFDYSLRINENCSIYQADESVHTGVTTGGIAVPAAMNEYSLDAYWLWTHTPPNTRVIILDDPEARLLRVACAAAGTTTDSASWTSCEPVLKSGGETEVILTFGGDVVLGTREKWMRNDDAFPAYLNRYGMAYPLEDLKSIFAEDHMTIVNLECVLKDDGNGEDKDRLYRFRGLPSWTEVLHRGSVEQVNVANNHHMDYGKAGSESTLAALEASGVPYSGYGAVYAAEINGHKIGFGGCRETTWLKGGQNIEEEIASLREQGCEVVIYTCHWGTEYDPVHNETQVAMAQAVAEAGADIIIGHHPHVVQGVGVIDGVPVIYSLGNLMFGGTHDMTTFDAAAARVCLRFGNDGYQGASITLIPILTSSAAGVWVNDFHPIPAQGEDAMRIMALIQADSTVLLEEDMFFPAR